MCFLQRLYGMSLSYKENVWRTGPRNPSFGMKPNQSQSFGMTMTKILKDKYLRHSTHIQNLVINLNCPFQVEFPNGQAIHPWLAEILPSIGITISLHQYQDYQDPVRQGLFGFRIGLSGLLPWVVRLLETPPPWHAQYYIPFAFVHTLYSRHKNYQHSQARAGSMDFGFKFQTKCIEFQIQIHCILKFRICPFLGFKFQILFSEILFQILDSNLKQVVFSIQISTHRALVFSKFLPTDSLRCPTLFGKLVTQLHLAKHPQLIFLLL